MYRCLVFFFFKQKTAYEMRISDWSSDVCSSDLHRLDNEHEKTLLTLLGRYPEMLRRAAAAYTPHTVVFYLKDLAEGLHSYYNVHRFLVEDDAELQNARDRKSVV